MRINASCCCYKVVAGLKGPKDIEEMKLYNFFIFTFLLCFHLGSGSKENCEEFTEQLKKQCDRYPSDFRNSCFERRLKRSLCANSCYCQDGDNNCNYRNVECREESSNSNSTNTHNIRTDVNVNNVINNHNKIQHQIGVKSSLINHVVLNQTSRENQICCQVLVPKCDNVFLNECSWAIQNKCGEMCKYPPYSDIIAPYELYRRFFYNFYARRCTSRWPYVNCNSYDCQYCYYPHCQQYQWCKNIFNWYYNYYSYYNWWKTYHEYLKKKNDTNSTDYESATVKSIDEEADTTDVNEDNNDDTI